MEAVTGDALTTALADYKGSMLGFSRASLVPVKGFPPLADSREPTPPTHARPDTSTDTSRQVPFVFNADGGILTYFVRPEKADSFELSLAKVSEALAASSNPERRRQALGWRVFKSSEPGPTGTTIYVNVLWPAVRGVSYSHSDILAEAFPDQAKELSLSFRDAIAGASRVELTLLEDFTQPSTSRDPGQAHDAAKTPQHRN
jgi:hypothetical protein